MARVPSIAGLSMVLATVSCAASDHQVATSPSLPVPRRVSSGAVELASFAPDASRIRMERRGDLDGDGDEDVLLVLGPEAGTDARFDPRTLLILLRGADGKLAKAVENPEAIPCERCGGMIGDPLRDIAIGNGGFTLRLEGGSRELWSQTFRFDYSSKDAMWVLVSIEEGGADRATGNTATKRRSFGDSRETPLDQFSIEKFLMAALP